MPKAQPVAPPPRPVPYNGHARSAFKDFVSSVYERSRALQGDESNTVPLVRDNSGKPPRHMTDKNTTLESEASLAGGMIAGRQAKAKGKGRRLRLYDMPEDDSKITGKGKNERDESKQTDKQVNTKSAQRGRLDSKTSAQDGERLITLLELWANQANPDGKLDGKKEGE
ncbi:hypothetical protein FRC08_005410 [Ceratobasidium sp. 394]|nr:hypothetical protein FRC08_005410 [Ceratobasidium sp. 394]KAG9086838.1 hypothetical protein FS749_003338 [Ceratobasidium sp. UAMH 11750]